MGSIVSLGIGYFEIDWGKNNLFINHSKLFLKGDKKLINSYDYEGELFQEFGYSRKLRDVKLRLDLLGYSMGGIEKKYNNIVANFPEYYPEINLSFAEFTEVISEIDLSKIAFSEDHPDPDLGEYVTKIIFSKPEFAKLSEKIDITDNDIGTFFENLDPYIQLRIFAENKANLDLDLEWRTQDIIKGGYVNEDELFECIQDKDKFLIVTEGTSDSFVIERAINLLRPDISDFFTYVDMEEGYPFSGTGNLYKFYQGLVSIKMQNKCLFIFDNDAEGIETFNKCVDITGPNNIRVTKLPDLDEFNDFLTIGPNGEHKVDVNGQAVAIECFLDLSYKNRDTPIIRWSSYKKSLQLYQGSLVGKDYYTKQFKKVKDREENYDFSKLYFLIDHIFDQCIQGV
ncbi:HEPN/Toprim-associated domain-containing protein [Psychromonas sp. PT13]|uniref:HEPN/Toprim-associated domain-containing protein n=1 Tax=Psychromonas sp. PT13 TaxID=3439547 RepID=UPI003EC0D9F4